MSAKSQLCTCGVIDAERVSRMHGTGSGVKGKKILFRTSARGWGPRSLLSSAAGVRPSERVQTAKLIFLLTKLFTESSIRVFF